MLNVGRLGPGAAEYYVESVATSAEDYYSGRGESQGRWVGSLARELGLVGAVDVVHFRRMLAGRHPFTSSVLVRHRGSRQVAPALDPDGSDLDTSRAAAYLGVSAQYVRRLLEEGSRYRSRLDAREDDEVVPEPSAFLFGEPPSAGGGWRVSIEELDRFRATRRQKQFRPGYDLTLRPPKSISVLWALAEPHRRQAIRQAHREAVDEVVRYYEDRAVFARRSDHGVRRLEPSDGLVAAAFDHRTSRAGDPLLHTHVVTANMTRTLNDEGEQVWRAIPGAGLFEHAKAAGHLYQAHLRHLLATRLGVQFEPVVNGTAEVIGVPKELTRHFSRRRAEIEAALSDSGSSSARAAQVATLQTRKAKHYGVEPDSLRDRWRAEATRLGVDASAVSACFGGPTEPEPIDRERLFDAMAGSRGLTELAAAFSRTNVIEAIASAVNASLPANGIEAWADAFLGSARTVVVERNRDPDRSVRGQGTSRSGGRSYTQRRYTTPQLAAIEAELLAVAAIPRTETPPMESFEEVLAARAELSDEQVAMVRAACRPTSWVVPVAGRPGAGKTFAVEAIVAAHVAADVPIVGAAVSANAAAELEAAAGFTRSTRMPATTVARLLLDLDEHDLAPGAMVVVDEASMLGTRALARLVEHARRVEGTVLLVGDPDQHGPVEVGGVFAHLCASAGDDLVQLVENNRQHDPADRLSIDDYRKGHVAEALARYDDTDRVVRSATASESFDAMAADWYAQRITDGDADPMIAGPNSTRQALNERARALLKANGDLSGSPLTVAGREFMLGDDVVARRNDRSLRGARSGFVRNGSTGRITAVHADDEEVTVEFDREGQVRIPRRYLLAGKLDHGYARTTYGVQGATHTVGRYHPTDGSGFEEGYVAITRAKHATRVYVVDGTITTASDLDHTPPEPHHHGLASITTALTRRTSDSTVAELAPDLDHVASLAASTPLASLTRRRRHLDRILADAPHDPAADIAALGERIDALLIRRRAWSTTSTSAGPQQERAVAAIDRQLNRHQHTMRRLNAGQQRYELWSTTHASTIQQRSLLRRAEHIVETRLRDAALADPNDPGQLVLGPPPALQSERRAWRRAIGDAAIYRARHELSPASDADPVLATLGPRPRGAGSLDWDHAAASVSAAAELLEAEPNPTPEP